MNSEYKSALFLSIKIGYLSSFQKQAANSLVTETLQYFVFFCRPAYSAILVKCLIINVLRFILAIPFFTAFLNITYTARHTWATMAYYSEVHPGIISEAMGHSSITVTETYLKPFKNKKIDEANATVFSPFRKTFLKISC
ncbi:integrase [Bacteroides thetaiotaomicron]|jgi:integrase|uniref:integrase n=1 Tax=Bacteroides thetaiotaomicron TaxID=818 RepID=UPI000D974618|nr:integrase [Bacteroides thetaiotaomicron]MCS2186953.1 integrase [Bacteroides thetaiotaomicron]MCS2683287.1 integrase [Bacteroides thetaiotaomicron]MCS2846180.1 integrase [Bacteroides thetaiotaomicron]QQA09302.1 integrase [Bacteroides thetaiotaomicron]SQA29643.1 integrase [Bacteroides thetaiotaomicron]